MHVIEYGSGNMKIYFTIRIGFQLLRCGRTCRKYIPKILNVLYVYGIMRKTILFVDCGVLISFIFGGYNERFRCNIFL